MANEYSSDCIEVLSLLKARKNVIISGPPGTGKSFLLSEVANAFINSLDISGASPGPVHVPGAPVAIPKVPPEGANPILQDVFPAPLRTDRQIFRTVFHQNSKHRDFITGMIPTIGAGGGFEITTGTLYRASNHAMSDNGAALLVIDEINRGPAVQVFGGSIVAIEQDKRLDEKNQKHLCTQYFELVDPDSGKITEYALPEHLYILAALNQADTSVEPLDVAFLRRWAPFNLRPNKEVLQNYFDLPKDEEVELPDQPTEDKHVFEAAIRAWESINSRIRLGRGQEFQLGHGVFMTGTRSNPGDLSGSLKMIAEIWGFIQAHIEEVFFGDLRGIAATLKISGSSMDHPFKLIETSFADEPRLDIQAPQSINKENIYSLLRSVADN